MPKFEDLFFSGNKTEQYFVVLVMWQKSVSLKPSRQSEELKQKLVKHFVQFDSLFLRDDLQELSMNHLK